MARQITMFKNLSVAAKLFGGFSVLLAIIILSSVLSIYQLSVIRDHSDKAQLVTQINEDLNTARRNRLVFQLNHDQKTMEANHAAIEKCRPVLSRAATSSGSMTPDCCSKN